MVTFNNHQQHCDLILKYQCHFPVKPGKERKNKWQIYAPTCSKEILNKYNLKVRFSIPVPTKVGPTSLKAMLKFP